MSHRPRGIRYGLRLLCRGLSRLVMYEAHRPPVWVRKYRRWWCAHVLIHRLGFPHFHSCFLSSALLAANAGVAPVVPEEKKHDEPAEVRCNPKVEELLVPCKSHKDCGAVP